MSTDLGGFDRILGITAEHYWRGLMEQITAPTMFDEPGSKVFDRDRGYWRERRHSARLWPEIEVIPGWFWWRDNIERYVRQPWAEARIRVREAKSILRHGIPERGRLVNSTAAACERLFTLMDNQPSLVRPEPIDPYLALQAQEEYLRGSLPGAAPSPPPLQPQR